MMASRVFLSCLALASASLAAPGAPQSEAASVTSLAKCSTVVVDLGYARYNGVSNVTTGINTWKGIRYAAAPIGSLRWQPPQAPAANQTIQDASNFGPICPQNYPSIPNPPFIPGNEDCLFLNVYAPKSANKLPVFVWIHGGGYGFGDGRQDMTEILQANNLGFVAVVIQYRLGAFGFLSSAEVKSRGITNAGLLDQAFSLQWVQNYISLFGGDATKVTIAGESSGGGSVMYHALTNHGQSGTKLFTQGIAASPYLWQQYNYDATVPTSRYYTFAKDAGCGSSGNVFDCLVGKDSLTLQQASSNVSTSQTYGTWAFLPVTDGAYITGLPSVQLAQKQVNGLRLLVGNNADEGGLFVPPNIVTLADLTGWLGQEFPNLSAYNISQVLAQYPSTDSPVDPAAPKVYTNGLTGPTAVNVSGEATGQLQRADDIYAEATFICPSYWLASAYTQPGKASYHYQYSVPLASHQSDIPAYFGPATPNQGSDFTSAFRQIFGNFITNNSPSISNTVANGPSSSNVKAANPASNWPAWADSNPQQVNLNQTGGTPYQFVTQWGTPVTQFQQPGLTNAISVVNAYTWEGGRGARCDFWKAMSPQIPA